MSDSFMPTLQVLPVEILHHILDDLDAHTVVYSFRNTCQRFRAVVDSYDRYVLNFQSISKSDFDRVCHLIDPGRVMSLILSENNETFDQIKLFHSHLHLREFNRLRSLSLFIHEEEQLRNIVERFNIPSLKVFSLKIGRWDDRRKTTTARLLSTIIAKSNLIKLELHMQEGRFEKIVWPAHHSIQYLKVDNCVAIDQIRTILRSSPHLRTLIINSFFILNPNQGALTTFEHLTSLTMNKVNMKIDDLESFLSMTPAVTHLRLIGNGQYSDGQQWEHFIQLHLPVLKKFEFFFTETHLNDKDPSDITHIISSFQTSFWLEYKKWFVVCELDSDTSRSITLYSIPICISFLSYETRKTSISTYPETNDERTGIMNNVETVRLDFTKLIPLDVKKQEDTIHYPLFHKIKKLELQFGTIRSFGWIDFVSNLIDLKTIVQIKVSSASIRQSNRYMLSDMAKLLRKTSNMSSIDICFDFLSRKSCLTAADLCFLIPSHVQHLAVAIKDLNEIQNILEQRPQLSSANFMFDYIPSWKEVTTWIDNNRKGSSYQADSFSVCVWLGQSSNCTEEINVGNKRVKLTDEHDQS